MKQATVWGTVVQTQMAARDIVRLRIALHGAPFAFSPGQHAHLAFEGLPSRPYVLANRPGDPLLEVHVQRVPGGIASERIVDEVGTGTRVRVTGPYGPSLLRKPAGQPMLMIAGGWGLAAIQSVLLAVLADPDADAGPVHVYHGVPEARELYDSAITAAGGGAVHYVPVVATPSVETTCRHGWVHEAVESDFPSLSGFKVYVAGPAPMVQHCVTMAVRLGARPWDVQADAFEDAADAHARALRPPPARRLLGAILERF